RGQTPLIRGGIAQLTPLSNRAWSGCSTSFSALGLRAARDVALLISQTSFSKELHMRGKVGLLCLVALCLSLGSAFVAQSFTVSDLRKKIETLEIQNMGESYKARIMQQNIEKVVKEQKVFQKRRSESKGP